MEPRTPEDACGCEGSLPSMYEDANEVHHPCRRPSPQLQDADADADADPEPSSTYQVWIPPPSPPSDALANEATAKTAAQKAFFEAVTHGDLPAVASHLDSGLDIERETNDGFSPLVIAILEHHLPLASFLLERGASLHHRIKRLPPLVHAAMSPAHGPEFMQMLLSYGAILTGVSGPENKNALHWAASEGLASSVEFLVKQMKMNLESRCSEDRTPMILAAQMGHEEVVKVLWAHHADLGAQSDNGGTPLIWAACKARAGVVKFLLNKGVDVEQRDNNGHAALSLASHFGHAEIVDILLAAGADIETRSEKPRDCSPLMAAVCSNAVDVVKSLIAHGADMQATAANGDSILNMAMRQGGSGVVNLLLKSIGGDEYPTESVAIQFAMAKHHDTVRSLTASASIMYSHLRTGEHSTHAWIDWVLDQGGDLVKPCAMATLLHAALKKPDIDMVKHLITHGCNVDCELEPGMTPLAYAVAHRIVDLVEILLEAGADPNGVLPGPSKPRGPTTTPLGHAIIDKNDGGPMIDKKDDVDSKMIELLLKSRRCRINQGKDVKCTAFSLVLAKCRTPESKDVALNLAERMLDSVSDVNADLDDNGFSLLHVATYHQNLWMIDLLLSRGADIEVTATDGTTPFLLACQTDPVLAMKLLDRGARLKAKTYKTNANALHAMAANGRHHVPQFHKMGLDINEQTLKGYTPLACALSWGHGPLACALMEWGAHLNWKTDRNLTALHLAARNGLHEAVERILEQDVVDISAMDTKGWTCLHEACATGTPATVTQLLDAGAEVERPLPNGDRPLHVALMNENEDTALLLLERGADASALGSKKRTPTHLAADHGLPRAAKELLRLSDNADVHALDEETWTPLCCSGHPEIVKMLIAAGADVHYADKDGWTPLHQAVFNSDMEAAVLLIEAGASTGARTTDDGLSVRERVADMWSWCDIKRRVIGPRVLMAAEARREAQRSEENTKATTNEIAEGLGGDFELVDAGR